jgi:hypothetical protein
MSDPYRPNIRHSLQNWKDYEGSFAQKLKLTLKNEFLKARHLKNCCGNAGEPGC